MSGAACILVVLSIVGLSGCVGAEPGSRASERATDNRHHPAELAPAALTDPASVFVTADAALAAAAEAFTAYLRLHDESMRIGGDFGALRGVATEDFVRRVAADAELFKANGVGLEGWSTFDGMELVEARVEAETEFVTAYVCLDTRGLHVIDAAGDDEPAFTNDRPRRGQLVQFQSAPGERARLIASGTSDAPDAEVCDAAG